MRNNVGAVFVALERDLLGISFVMHRGVTMIKIEYL
jgi:hypothetical protein